MITVSPTFDAAQKGSVAQPTYLIYLVLPDGCIGATATSSGDDASGNFPASGAINGDVTEINIGAASSADNGVGKSSWKSSANPDGTGNVTLTITFSASTTFNRLKLYNLASDPLTSYVVQYWTGSAWTTFAGTNDKYEPTGTTGYGQGGYGLGPYGGDPSLVGVTGGADQFNFASITTTKIQLIVYKTKSGGPAQVIELQVFRKIDVTSRCMGFKIDRKKDFKLSNPISTQADLTFDNSDQFFSISYTPTAAQATSGYVNSVLAGLGFNVEINEGFITSVGTELIRTFTGSADSLTVNARNATASLQARDFMKHLINQIDSCKLQTSIDIGIGANPLTGITGCVQYCLNKNNISNYEMSLTTTSILLDYFFTYQTSILTTIQQLVQATGDAIFYFDENGTAVFQNFGKSNNSSTTNAVSEWQSGTSNNIDSISIPGSIQPAFFGFPDVGGSTWSLYSQTGGPARFSYQGGSNNLLEDTAAGTAYARTPFARNTGSWYISFTNAYNGVRHAGDIVDVYFCYDGNTTVSATGSGYLIRLIYDGTSTYTFTLYKTTPSGLTSLGAKSYAGINGTPNHIFVTRNGSGSFIVYADLNGWSSIITATDNTFNSCAYFGIGINETVSSGSAGIAWLSGASDSFQYSPTILGNPAQSNFPALSTAPSTPYTAGLYSVSIWTSATIDQNPITTEGTLILTDTLPAGTSITVSTRTSADQVTWTPWTSLNSDSSIASTSQRYIQARLTFTSNTSTTAIGNVTVMTINWTFGTGSSKYSVGTNFTLTSINIENVQETISDNLGGSTAIINDVAITSSPLILGGSATVTWQAIVGTPATAVSASNPLAVSIGTLTFNITISGGMDTSAFGTVNTGTSDGTGGINLTFASGAVGSAKVTYTHPTKPILTITITTGGTITNLQLSGKAFTNVTTPYQALGTNAASIQKHKKRHQDISNNYIVSNTVAGTIASRYITNFKNPITYIPSLEIWPLINVQPGDQFQVTETLTAIGASNFYLIGYTREIRIGSSGATASMSVVLLPVT